MRILITRAENEAVNLGNAVKALGCEPLVAPMLDIQFKEDPIDLEGVQGIVVTSGNAIRALEKASEERDIPVYCVGPQTRKLAESLGFTQVHNSFGGIKNLPILIGRESAPDKGPLLLLHGGNLTGNPVQELNKARFRVRSLRVYSAGPVDEFPEDVRTSLEKDGAPDLATFFSIRTFKMFRELAQKEGLIDIFRDTAALCISPAVADFAREMRWKRVFSAEDMTGPAVLKKIEELVEEEKASS